MNIERKDLIEICDKYFNNEFDENDIAIFSSRLMFAEDLDYDEKDEILWKTIFEWHNPDINYPINDINMRLWKNRLENDVDELDAYNFWNKHIEEQRNICTKYGSIWKPVNKKLQLHVSNITAEPVQGIRQIAEKGTIGWYIWSGNLSENYVSFEQIRAEELLSIRPKIIKYLGLDIGSRFFIDKIGVEHVEQTGAGLL